MNLDPNTIVLITTLISILAVSTIAGVAVIKSGGTAKEAIRSGTDKAIRGIIGNEDLSTTVERNLSAIPQDKRNAVIEFIEMATPLTDKSTISKDAAQWIQNMLDGKVETGAVAAPSVLKQTVEMVRQRIEGKPVNDAEAVG